MATNILMPALSPTMTEGTLARWLKKEGDAVRAGDVIAEIETDKATMEVEAVDEGVLGKILVADGTAGVKVNDPIAILVDQGESVDAAPAAAARADAVAPKANGHDAAPAPATSAAANPAPITKPTPAHDGPRQNGPTGAQSTVGRVFASPLARRMAQQAGIDLSALSGSGPNGRIVRADIDAYRAKGPAPAAAAAPTATPAAPVATPASVVSTTPAAPRPLALGGAHTLVPHSTMRRTIARRLSEAKQSVPHFYASIDVQLDALLDLRARLNEKSPEGAGAYKLSVNDFVIKGSAATLRRVPKVNASFTDDATAFYDDVDISVAVSIPDGLITPIIRRADQKGLAAISNEMKELAGRAKAGKLKPEEFQGGGFSISNMGMYGVSNFAAIINPPQGAILAVAAGEKRPVVRGDQLAVATVMTVTLSVDHRIVDGALAAEWLAAFKRIMEDPLSLML